MAVDEEQKEKILKKVLEGHSERKIKSELSLTSNELDEALIEIRSDISKYTHHDQTRYFINETFAQLAHMEALLWVEFHSAPAGGSERVKIIKLISDLRKEGISLRERLGKFREEPAKDIPFEKIKALPQNIKMTISQIVLGQLEDFEELPEPTPPDKIIDSKIEEKN